VDCPHIPELGYSHFARRLQARVAGRRIPVVGSLELTFRCNLRCVHCYVAHGHHGLPEKELTARQIRGILDQVVDAGCLWLLLTGGEPLLRPDFLDVYTHARRRGLIVTLFTNGTLLTPRIADYLAEWRPFVVEITLYGSTQATYERITGVPGSHARCLRGIELLLDRGVPLKLKTMLMTLNRHELWDIRAYADSLGVDFRFDPMVNAGLEGSGDPLAYRLAPEEVVAFDLADARRLDEWRAFCDRFRGVRPDGRHLYVCGAAQNSFHVDPCGHLSACLISRRPAYDLRRGTFRQGWLEFLAAVRSRQPAGSYPCGTCELLALCGQCPGWGQLEHGDPEQPVDFLCQVAHRRARAFGWNARRPGGAVVEESALALSTSHLSRSDREEQ
jgi:radical SAM protein with 4Fe4S-binding SPASM domain